MRINRKKNETLVLGLLSFFVVHLCLLFPPSAAGGEMESADEENQSSSLNAESARTGRIGDTYAGKNPVYFYPSDNDATATVLLVTNLSEADIVVNIEGYSETGVLVFSRAVSFQPRERKIFSSDAIAVGAPPSWSNVEITNFTDFTTLGVLYVPDDVFVDGYVVFNPGTGVVDPRLDQGNTPLMFGTGSLQGSHFYVIPGRRR